MNTTELGVYILGATALALLAAAGIAVGSTVAATSAVISAGLAYLAQILAWKLSLYAEAGQRPTSLVAANTVVALCSLAAWGYGVLFGLMGFV